MNEQRKHGLVKDFRICDDEYLELINTDLNLGLKNGDLSYLQNVYREEGKDPSVDELCTDAALIHSTSADPECFMTEFRSSDPTLISAFSQFVRDHGLASDPYSPGIRVADAFGAACKPFLSDIGNSFAVMDDRQKTVPSFPAAKALCRYGSFTVYASNEKAVTASPLCNCGILITPRKGNSDDAFIEAVSSFLKNIKAENPDIYWIPCTRNGLLRDIANAFSSAVIFSGNLPDHKDCPENCVSAFLPAILLMVPEPFSNQCRNLAISCGFFAETVFLIPNHQDGYRIYSHPAELRISQKHIRKMTAVRTVAPKAEELPLQSEGYRTLYLRRREPVEAFEAKGDFYAFLLNILAPGASYAVCGEVCPEAPDTVTSLLALDAFLRKNKPRILTYTFTEGRKNAFTVFRFGVPPLPETYAQLKIPSYTFERIENEPVNPTDTTTLATSETGISRKEEENEIL